MILPNESAGKFLRVLRQMLTAGEVGQRFGDNVGPTATLRYVDAEKPFDVTFPGLRERPESVVVLAARNASNPENGTESGGRVRWDWIGGRVRVHEIAVITTADDYDVKLGAWRA